MIQRFWLPSVRPALAVSTARGPPHRNDLHAAEFKPEGWNPVRRSSGALTLILMFAERLNMNVTNMLLLAGFASTIALPVAGRDLERDDGPTNQTSTQAISKGWLQSLYDQGLSVENLLDESRVYDKTGRDVGQVDNVVFSRSGKVLAIVAEISGFFDMSETHVSIPWGQIGFTKHRDTIELPVDKADLEKRSTVDEDGVLTKGETAARVKVKEGSSLKTGNGIFLAHQLLGDRVYLESGRRWGNLNDLAILDGRLAAIVVEVPDQGPSRHFAYPFKHETGGPVDAKSPRYTLPFSEDEADKMAEFDYERLFTRRRHLGD